jgi:hypothetical protein
VPALGIRSVEARHAAWIRFINGANPAPEHRRFAQDGEGRAEAVGATGFING